MFAITSDGRFPRLVGLVGHGIVVGIEPKIQFRCKEPHDRLIRLFDGEFHKRYGLLVVAETYYPGWRARIDGKPAQVLEVNGALRGLPVPKGAHTVEFEYSSDTVRWGGVLTACGSLVAAVLLTRVR